jgi:hypothetical protein
MAPLPREAALRTLGLDSDADEESIRKAYKRLALQHHPDVSRPPCLLGRWNTLELGPVTSARTSFLRSPPCVVVF